MATSRSQAACCSILGGAATPGGVSSPMHAGHDSEDNHRIARLDMNVRPIIPARAGRPTSRPPTEPFRRDMDERFKLGVDQFLYGQCWRVETVNSMIKRNLGSALRARISVRRKHKSLLRVLTHNIMLLAKG